MSMKIVDTEEGVDFTGCGWIAVVLILCMTTCYVSKEYNERKLAEAKILVTKRK